MSGAGRTPPMQPQNLQARFDEVADHPSRMPAAATASEQIHNQESSPPDNGVSQEEMVEAFTAFGQHLAQQISTQLSSLSEALVSTISGLTGRNNPVTGVPATREMLSSSIFDPIPRVETQQNFNNTIPPQQSFGQAQRQYPNPNYQPLGNPMLRQTHMPYQHPEAGHVNPGIYPPPPSTNQNYPTGPYGGVRGGSYAPPEQLYHQQRLTGHTRRQPETGFEEEGPNLLERFGQTAFTDSIIFEPTPMYFVAPKMKEYSGQTDPTDHVCNFQDSLTIYTLSDQMRCRLFLMTLIGEARQWFSSLPPQSICNFGQFVTEFLAHFSSSRKPQRTSDVLLSIRQGQAESLRDYVCRFRSLLQTVTILEPAVARSAFKMGLKDGLFKHSLSTMPLHTMERIMRRAWLYINAEEEKASSNAIADAIAPESSAAAGSRRER